MLEGQFGKYRIDGIAGVGGMSVVYRAFDEMLGRLVALKVLNAQRAVDEISLRRFQREAQIALRLKHPNIITIYEAGEVNGQAYLAMEYLPEGSLARRFSKPVAMSLGASSVLLSEIASALDYAHANGVVHRDLKLENILVRDDGHIALSDFGIAQILDVSSLTETGQTFGTPLYVSPEQVRGAKNVDFRTDLYSLGVIAYLLATGYFPFSGNSGMAILHSHLTQEPPLPSNLNPRLPPQMDWVLLKSLSKYPQDRFASAGAHAEAFAGAIPHVSEVEIVILASQPTPIISQASLPGSGRAGQQGVRDTVPIDSLIAPKPPRRSGGSATFRLIAALLLLALVSVALLGLSRVLTPPPVDTATQPSTLNAELVETRTPTTSPPTSTPTTPASATPSPTRTVPPTNTPTTPAPTATRRTITPSATRTRTPTSTALMLLITSPTPTRRITSTRIASATRTATSSVSTAAPTHVPATSVPPTSVPPTSVPPTSVPPTSVPPTSIPPTQVPPTQPPPPTATGVLDPLIPPLVPTVVCVLLC